MTLRLLDEHSSTKSLLSLEEALYEHAFRQAGFSSKMIRDFYSQYGFHPHRIAPCVGHANIACQMEGEFERWEHSMMRLRQEGQRTWRDVTGVTVQFSRGQLSPRGKTSFSFLLPPREGKWLTIQYGAGEVPKIEIPPLEYAAGTRVSPDDLTASRFVVLLNYAGEVTLLSALVFFGYLVLGWAWLTSETDLPTYEVFNWALRTRDEKLWCLGRERRKDWLGREYEKAAAIFRRPASLTRDRLFQLVREGFNRDHALYDLYFENTEQLDNKLREYMRLAALS